MGRLAYGVPLVGNDFAVMPLARPLVQSIPVAKPADLPYPEIDDSLLRSIDIETVAEEPGFQARAKSKVLSFVKYTFLGLSLFVLAAFGLTLLRPGQTNLAASQAPAAEAGVRSAPLSVADSVVRQKVTIMVAGQAVSPSATELNNWLSRDLTAPAANQLVVNQDAIKNYLKSLGGPHDKAVKNRILATSGAVLSEGQDGQKLDIEPALNVISSSLLSGNGMNVNLPVVAVPAQTVSVNDIDKLLVANVTTKRMVAYERGKEVKQFLISAGIKGNETPTGQFTITRKFAKDDMAGNTPGGGRYFVANVKWVSYFEDGIGAAIHANDWRSPTIFGNVNTTYGCIGVTVADAEWVFNWAPTGTILVNQK